MGGLALLARAAGHRVSGCDANVYPPMSTQLQAEGIDLIEGFDADQIGLGADCYVIGNVVSRGNPLLEAILDAGLPYVSGPQWLGDHVLREHHVLAVAGTHGKTTTTAMLTHILTHAGLAPSFLVGGVPLDSGVSAHLATNPPSGASLAQGRPFVIEADEYDTAFFDKRSKFVHYRPRTAILNNLEYDHADIFENLAAIETQFHHLVRTVPASGRVIAAAPSGALDRVLARGCWSELERFGTTDGWHAGPPDPDGHFEVRLGSAVMATVRWQHTGAHNRANALAALLAARHVGVPPVVAAEALSGFEGVRRRQEVRGTIHGVTVYDDFAHHPTAIATTIAGLRETVGQARILAVLEPRSNTMKLGTMSARLPDALAGADLVYCYAAHSGKDAVAWSPADALAPLGERATTWHDLEPLIDAVVAAARPGDHILVMSNGSFGGIHDHLLQRLARRGASS